MFHDKKSPVKIMMCVGALLLAAGAVIAWMMGSKKGRKITKKARHIGKEVEALIKEELR